MSGLMAKRSCSLQETESKEIAATVQWRLSLVYWYALLLDGFCVVGISSGEASINAFLCDPVGLGCIYDLTLGVEVPAVPVEWLFKPVLEVASAGECPEVFCLLSVDVDVEVGD